MTRVPSEYRPLVKRAKKCGWRLEVTGGGHLRLRSPQGRTVVFPASPSNHRGVKNFRSDLRRSGLDV